MASERQLKMVAAWRGPRSVCICGHTGDGSDSDHMDLLSKGHGPCRECDCQRFTWAGFTQKFEKALDREAE